MNRARIHFLLAALGAAILAGCGGGGPPGLRNSDPGANDEGSGARLEHVGGGAVAHGDHRARLEEAPGPRPA